MLVQDILKQKGPEVHTIVHDATMADVVRELVRFNVGSLVVTDEQGRMVGIISERDVLRACNDLSEPLAEVPVQVRMTKKVVTGRLQQTVPEVMGLMTSNRVRHLPIIEDDQLAGMVSIGDVVKANQQVITAENHHLLNYIHG